MNIAIIPARGGSKRIPKKNIRNFNGKAIICYAIETALKAKVFQHIIVSTDSEEIASIARKAGAEVPFIRPRTLADDFTPITDVLLHSLAWFEKRDTSPNYICCILPTAVFVNENILQQGLQKIRSENSHCVFAATTFDFPIPRAMKKNEQGYLEMVWPEHELSRSNDLTEYYHDAGQFYWLETTAFRKNKRIFSTASSAIFMPRNQAVDIDTEEDWVLAETLHKLVYSTQLPIDTTETTTS